MKKIFAFASFFFFVSASCEIYTVHASGAEAARWEHAVFAQDDGHGGHFKHRVVGRIMAHVARELKLTEAQQTEIRAVFAAERQNVMPLLQRLREARQQYDSANAPGGFDEAKARAYASRQAETIAELLVAKERVKSKVYAMLTPEQREKADTMHERFAARVHEHFHSAGL